MQIPDEPGPRFEMPRLPRLEMPQLPLGGLRKLVWIAVAVIVVFGSYFQVNSYEQAVVLRFGKHVRTVGEGPHLKIPLVESVYKVPTQRQLKEEFGFRTLEVGKQTTYQKEGYGNESQMLTGDLNIADVEFVVQYKISDPYRYLFALDEPTETIRSVAEAEMRGAVGDLGFNEVIKSQRPFIEAQVRQRMNEILKSYNAGVDVKLVQLQDVHPPAPVKDSFEEVNRAVQEMERAVNEALQERNKVLFRVEGEAKQRIAQAQGTQIERVNRARGDAARFTQLLSEYQKAPAVTRQRLYLEAMQATLPQTGRILVVDDSVKGMMPVLNVDPSGKALPEAVPAAAAPAGGGTQ